MKKHLYLEDIWNDVLVATRQRKDALEPRNHIWASEIGKDYWERYQKMIGTPPTEKLEERVLRKFAAGNIFEELIGRELSRVGVIRSSQEPVEIPENDEHLRISGKIDYITGLVNWSTARKAIDAEPEDYMTEILHRLVDHWEKEYPKGFEPTLVEIKTINSLVFWAKKDYLAEAYPHHVMQLYTYLKAKNMPVGRIVYLSKDDLTIKEMTVGYPDEKLEAKWNKDVQTITEHIRSGTEPLKPKQVVFDDRGFYSFQKDKKKYKISGCWRENWEVGWSSYFQLLTGVDDKKKWEESLRPEINKLNGELKLAFIAENNL